MKREVIITSDGSSTIQLPEWNEQYHSIHGAIQEAQHVFIKNGLKLFNNKEINILEIGFGTGLNCFITFLEAVKLDLKINYIGIEAYPVEQNEIEKLNYVEELKAEESQKKYGLMHTNEWGENFPLSKKFNLEKRKQLFNEIEIRDEIDLIYFDAFGARVQPELWTEDIFKIMFNALKCGGKLVTYSAKGSVRRAMQAVGFEVERLPGPPGKREMLRATKK